MQVKNISARGWWVMGTMVKPGETATVEATIADIGDNPDLVIVEEVAEAPEEPEQNIEPDPDLVVEESAEPVPEVVATVEPEKRKPGRPAK